jgi:type VI secretion system protein ImpL
MMSLGRIFGLMLLFLFFEAVVAVVTTFLFPQTSVFLACLAMTCLAIGTWTLFFLLMRLRSQRGAKQAVPSKAFVPAPLKASPGDDSFTLEFSALVAEANRRLQILASSNEARVAPSVATLPLYLVLGAEGSGKTTAIVNSGLEPRLLAGEAQKDGTVLPTSAANLWFADGAVFVEFAGRLLMQEPARWERALEILGQKTRSPWWKRALNGSGKAAADLRGVVIVCETEALLRANDMRRVGSVARTLNERLQTLQATMRIDVPAYVLLSKCDAIPHFQEFFATLSDAEGRRILGASLPSAARTNDLAAVYAELEGSRLNKLYNRLSQSVADKRMLFLAREESAEKRALAYEFPREFKKLRGEVVELLLDIFRPSTLYPPFRFRGFYFSGKRLVPRAHSPITTEVGPSADTSAFRKPMDATVIFSGNRSSTLDFSINLKNSPKATTDKWAFLTDVFRQVILSDPAGKMTTPQPRLGDSKYVSLAFGAAGAVFLALSILWVFLAVEPQLALRRARGDIGDTHRQCAESG